MKTLIFYSDRKKWNSLQQYIIDCCEQFSAFNCCAYLDNKELKYHSYSDLLRNIYNYGFFLDQLNLSIKHVAIIGRLSFEWISAYLGMLTHGYVVIPLDGSLSEDDILFQFCFSDAEVLLYDSKNENISDLIKEKVKCKCYSLQDIPKNNAFADGNLGGSTRVLTDRTITNDSIAEIVYTSGTTGRYKGVMLSYGNLLSNVLLGSSMFSANPETTVLSILPNSHVFQLTVGILIPLYFGATIAIVNDLKQMKKFLPVFKPMVILAVPEILNMFQREIMLEIKRENKEKQFKATLMISKGLRKLGIDIRKTLFHDIMGRFGNKFTTFICGGAYLAEEVISFFDELGVAVVQGYGITECAPLVSCNTDRFSYLLGQPGPEWDVKCINGELCVKGKNVMIGYYKDEAETEKVLVDGWFHTGDIGFIDDERFVSLTGRITNAINNTNGEKVSPEIIENQFECIDAIADCIVYSKDNLITIEILPNYRFFQENHILNEEEYLRGIVNNINYHSPKKYRIENMVIRNIPFEKTTTMKIKRSV